MAPHMNVVLGQDKTHQTVFECRQRRQEAVSSRRRHHDLPYTDLAVLVGGKDLGAGEGNGFDGAGGRFGGIEGVDVGSGRQVEDVDLVEGGSIEEVVVGREAAEVGC